MHLPISLQEKCNKQDEKIENLLLLLERLQRQVRELERKIPNTKMQSSINVKKSFHHPAIHFPMESN
tara:strand:+ start:325 stop:525 length:201 start_codon:yes stop_codon:yes gene_type:complete